MTFPYSAKYNHADVVSLFDAIAPVWKKEANEVPGLEVDKLFQTLKSVCDGWRQLEAFEVLDKDLQALLAMATATNWFTKVQVDEIDTWLGEVADCGEAEDWMQNFPEDELREVVLAKLKCHEVTDYQVDTVSKAITIEYAGGNYGTGRHDGSVYISDDGLKIYDGREAGKCLVWLGDLPEKPEDLGKCLTSSKWKETWEEEEW
mmetsp:Transcript_89916/g.159997  ORF Transcript_89916/g.159997 Transcript_89916/m.159997 type:complete len:204 (-) Transcript_89916:41-652(-)